MYLWTGHGWGKTTSALGVALRAMGHGKKVVILQWMKGWGEKVGEYHVRKQLGPKLKKLYDITQCGRKEWVNLKVPAQTDKALAKKCLALAKKKAQQKPFLLILDEINLAVAVGLLSEKEVFAFLDSVPPEVHVYMTGRSATPGLRKRADFVNDISMRKGPKKLSGEEGIDY